MVIKKSSYCWLLEKPNVKVITDRLQRFMKNTQRNTKQTREPSGRSTKRCREIEKKIKQISEIISDRFSDKSYLI